MRVVGHGAARACAPARLRPMVLQHATSGLLLLRRRAAPASPSAGYEKMCSLRLAHRSCVMQRRSSWQFSRPPHCVASIGSSTARMMSATETVSARSREVVAAAGAAHALDQAVAAQLAEQLLQVGQRNLLALGHAGQRHRALRAVHRDVDHRRDGESSFGGQAHGRSLAGVALVGCLRRGPIGEWHCPDNSIILYPDRFSQLKDPTSSLKHFVDLLRVEALGRRLGVAAIEPVALQLGDQRSGTARRSPPRGRAAGGWPGPSGRSCPRRSRRPRNPILAAWASRRSCVVAGHDPRRDADGGRPGRNVAHDDRVGADLGAVADQDRPQDLGAGADHHALRPASGGACPCSRTSRPA